MSADSRPSQLRLGAALQSLLRGPALAARPGRLIIAGIGLATLHAVLSIIGGLPSEDVLEQDRTVSSRVDLRDPPNFAGAALFAAEPFVNAWTPFAARVIRLPGWSTTAGWRGFLGGVAGLLIWGILGAAICRSVALETSGGRKIRADHALRFAASRTGAIFTAPLAPCAVATAMLLPCALVGGLNYLPQPFGGISSSILGFVPLVFSAIAAPLFATVVISWPLMIATIAVESEDAFDAVSRSISYVQQNKLRLLLYLVFAWILGMIGVWVGAIALRFVLDLARFATESASPSDFGFLRTESAAMRSTPEAMIQAFWLRAFRGILVAWVHSFAWTAMTLIYLRCRLDVDQTDEKELRDVTAPKA